ncbi:MAG TPA: hypothetical protein VMD09_08795 [Solirubrobacteraceae bacterium]|nr:hypothetical protein [Solirubrobacteraceae bacterium]
MGLRVAVAVIASVCVGGWATAAVAQADPVTDVTMYSDTGDYIGQGEQQVFTPANSTIGVAGDSSDFTVSVGGYTMEFAAPQGQTLQTGVYDGAARASFRTGPEPGIDISGDGRGCDTDQGRFEIKDIAFNTSGVPDRLWLVYEQHCEGAVPALFGEVRINEPADSGAGTLIPGLVRWPVNGPGVPETVVPMQFVASAATQMSAASLGGEDPGDFEIREDDCNGSVLTPGEACDVYVRFVPTAPGLRTATLNLTDGTGAVHSVPLQGWTYGGTTRLVMNSDTGDYIGQGQQYSFTPSSDTFEASGDRNGFTFSVGTADGEWTGTFNPGQGDIFTPGTTYTGAQRDAFRGSAPGMEIDSPGRGCNTLTGDFEVTTATFASDGTMQTFAIKFDQYCEGASAGLHGEFDWRAGDTTPRAPWMGPGGPCSPTDCSASSESSSGGSSGSSQTGSSTSTGATNSPNQPSAGSSPGGSGNGSGSSATESTSPEAKLRGLQASVLATDRRLAKAMAQLRRDPRNAHARGQAESALGTLAHDISTLRELFASASPAAANQPEGKRILSALSTLGQILRAERKALARHGARGLAAALRVARRNAGRERRALAVLAAAD